MTLSGTLVIFLYRNTFYYNEFVKKSYGFFDPANNCLLKVNNRNTKKGVKYALLSKCLLGMGVKLFSMDVMKIPKPLTIRSLSNI